MSLPSFTLARLPCGCAVEREQHVHAQVVRGHGDVAECPWCLATFDVDDVVAWTRENQDPFVITKPTVLVRVGERLLQVTGVCGDCEVLLAREAPGAASLHLRVPAEEIVFLEN